MFQKIFGLFSIIFGIWLIIGFPFLDKYQPEGMARFSTFIGIILIGIGMFLLKY
ncbi:MAG: hypothetical protein QXL14_00615 [Candidatus Aenigmatarchaeota archaeon]